MSCDLSSLFRGAGRGCPVVVAGPPCAWRRRNRPPRHQACPGPRSGGKTLRGSGRGSKRGEDKALHLLSAFAVDLSAVIGDLAVAPDANEITAAITLLKRLPLNGAVITGDAIFAQREICRHIQDAGGHYLFTVKANQPALRRDIEIAFGDDSPLSHRPLRPA